MKHPRKPKNAGGSGVSKIGPNTTVDNRLTHASLLLGYLFKYGVDLQRRTINLTGEIDADTFNTIDRAMSEMEAESRHAITIKINSEGGYASHAMAIVGRIEESKCKIVTKGYGEVMSAATIILASGDERLISKRAIFMWHEASYGLGFDRHSTNADYIKQAEVENLAWANLMASLTNKKAKFWLEEGKRRDAYFTPEELIAMGVVDGTF